MTAPAGPPPATGGARPVRRHRLPLARRPATRRLFAAVLIAAALATGGFITEHRPTVDSLQRPFVRTGATGVPVDARRFEVTVLGVRGAAVLTGGPLKHPTSGVWLLVKVRIVATDGPTSIGYAALRDPSGRTYRATERIDQPMVDGARRFEPGIPVTGEIAFEVPVGVADRLSLLIEAPSFDQRMDAMAQIPLPVPAGAAAGWRSAGGSAAPASPRAGS